MSDEEGEFFGEESEEEEVPRKKRKTTSGGSGKSKKSRPDRASMIDDAAEESGDDGDDDEEEEEDDENENDYVRDGFVVDEDEVVERSRTGDLEDSDDDGDEDDYGDRKRKKGRLRRMGDVQMLDEDDLDLINEARGIVKPREEDLAREREQARRVRAQNEAELRKGLFKSGMDSDEEAPTRKAMPKKSRVERYDEDGMDDFIDDDIGDQDAIMASDLGEYQQGGISEEQLNEASAIFGTDYLDYMQEEQAGEDDDGFMGRSKYREDGVGIDYGGESDVSEEEDDDDLFGDDNSPQKAEALRLKREKRKLSKEERRRQARLKKAQRAKAELRKNFEPVQLIENFCTEKDDEIRIKDAPERFYDWNTPFHGPTDGSKKISDEEEEEAMWIMSRIPEISSEFFTAPSDGADEEDDGLNKTQRAILDSIAHALRSMHQDKLEPPFIKRYRADIVTSVAVRENLYQIMDQDDEWERLSGKRTVAEDILTVITSAADGDEAQGAEHTTMKQLKEDLATAQDRLDDVLKQESNIKDQLAKLKGDDPADGEDDDDDDLFGKDEDENNKQQKENLQNHLNTIQSLMQERADKVAQLSSSLKAAETRNAESLGSQGPSLAITKKMCRSQLWNTAEYEQYISSLTEEQDVDDMKKYLSLLREGNDAIRKKETPGSNATENDKAKKRSRSVNHDLYRSRVAEGLRPICYKFMVSPFRAGIKLEDMITKGGFAYDRALPSDPNDDPLNWVAPKIESSPTDFANEMVGNGELVQVSSDDLESSDPLSGCRFVAAIELAYEPRIRRYMRTLFRQRAVLTTRPTKKGLDNIDAFHDYYGLHLIRHKPIKEHFVASDAETAAQKARLGPDERKEFDKEMKKREVDSCLQYLRVLEAEHLGFVTVHVHMPYLRTDDENWFKEKREDWINRENQDVSILVEELKKVSLPADDDTDEWNEERMKVLKFALMKVILPEFEKEARRDLREASTKVGIRSAGENLMQMAMEGPYRPVDFQSQNRFLLPTGDLPMVGVCVASDGKEASYLASVTDMGEMNDHVAIPSGQRIDDNKVKNKVIDFLMLSRPAAVLVGTSGGLASRMMSRKLSELITQATEKWNSRFVQGADEDDEEYERRTQELRQKSSINDYEDDSTQWKCNVDLVDDTVSQLFGRSVRGKKEFPDKEVNLKIAVAIARHAKDPLAELTYAYNVASDTGLFGTEMFFLNLHPMQRFLPKTRLLKQYERVLCEATSEVGVDVNCSCAYDHLLGSLTFVPGLGPRKAANLKQNIVRIGGAVSSRRALLAKRLMGPIVYNNSAAFIRIRDIDQLANQYLHPLDDTRLHPDVYHRNNWASKIAIDALERVEEDNRDKEAFGITALRDVMEDSREQVRKLFDATKKEWERHYGFSFDVAAWNPRINVPSHMWRDKVEELDLDAFANMIEQGGMGKWKTHLQMIKWEFRLPYADPRNPMQPLAGDVLFKLLTGETDQSLRPGKEVTGKVVRNMEFGSRVKLEGDVGGFIPLRNLADERVETAEDVVTIGSVVTAVITEVKKDHMCVDMSLRMEDFRKPQSAWDRPESLPALDTFFDRAAAKMIEQQKSKEREVRLAALQVSLGTTKIGGEGEDADSKRRTGRVTRRACAHPAFRNSKNDEVDRELREGGEAMVGEALIRPSSKSSDSLAIHWVVKLGNIKVIEVLEEDKDTDASIGKILKVKDETYESIDELLGRYVAPMNDNVETLVNHRKFLDISEDDLDEKLKEMKRKNPGGVFYHICWMEMHPGYASLRFILSSTPRHHPIGIVPKGFTWGSKTYSNLDRLLNDFKKNPRGVSSSSNRSVASGASRSTLPSKAGDKSSRWGSKPPPPPGRPPAFPAGGNSDWGAPSAGGGYLPPAPGRYQQPPPPGQPPSFPPEPSNFQAPPGPPPNFGQAPPYRPPPPPGAPTPTGYPPHRQ